MYKSRAKKADAITGKRKGLSRGRTTGRDSPAYWEARLERMGLAMTAGTRDFICYGHDTNVLDFDGKKTWPQTGESLEHEWPASLT